MRAEDGVGQDDVLAALAEILADVARIDPADVTHQARFDDLGIDSLTMVDAVVALEDRFGLVIPDDEWARFETVGDAVAHLQSAARLPR
jgi:acyl carrier protein